MVVVVVVDGWDSQSIPSVYSFIACCLLLAAAY